MITSLIDSKNLNEYKHLCQGGNIIHEKCDYRKIHTIRYFILFYPLESFPIMIVRNILFRVYECIVPYSIICLRHDNIFGNLFGYSFFKRSMSNYFLDTLTRDKFLKNNILGKVITENTDIVDDYIKQEEEKKIATRFS